MNIEIGDYARTNLGHIGKITDMFTFENGKVSYPEPQEWIINNEIIVNEAIEKLYITKYSKNIMNLIKIGDFVNGHKVIDNNYCYLIYDDDFDFGEEKIKGSILLENSKEEMIIDCEFEIETILTKEQYEINCFKRRK